MQDMIRKLKIGLITGFVVGGILYYSRAPEWVMFIVCCVMCGALLYIFTMMDVYRAEMEAQEKQEES